MSMNRDRDRAGSLRASRAGAPWLAALAAAATLLTTAAVAQDAAPPATPAPAAADSTAPPAAPATPETPATPAADPNAAPATPPPAVEAPKAEAPKTETPKSEAVPAPKPKRSLKQKNALPSKAVAGAPAKAAKPLATQPGANAAPPSAATASAKAGGSVAVKKVQAEAKAAEKAPQASIEERTTYQYNTLGRRDPFESLVESFVGDDVGGDAPPDVGGVTVVGIVWGADAFALVEDGRGNSLILRRGDKVMNGYVEELKRDAMIVKLTVDGQSQSVAIPLTRKGEQTNANR